MATLTITISDEAAEWIKDLVDEGAFASESDYLNALIQSHQDRLLAALDEGEASGPSGRTLEDIWEDVKARHALKQRAVDA